MHERRHPQSGRFTRRLLVGPLNVSLEVFKRIARIEDDRSSLVDSGESRDHARMLVAADSTTTSAWHGGPAGTHGVVVRQNRTDNVTIGDSPRPTLPASS